MYVHHQRQDKQTGDQVIVTVDYTILGKIFRFVIISFEVSSFKMPQVSCNLNNLLELLHAQVQGWRSEFTSYTHLCTGTVQYVCLYDYLHNRPLYFRLCTRTAPIVTRMAAITSPTKTMTPMAIPAACPPVQGSVKRGCTVLCLNVRDSKQNSMSRAHEMHCCVTRVCMASQRALPKTMQETQTRYEQIQTTRMIIRVHYIARTQCRKWYIEVLIKVL